MPPVGTDRRYQRHKRSDRRYRQKIDTDTPLAIDCGLRRWTNLDVNRRPPDFMIWRAYGNEETLAETPGNLSKECSDWLPESKSHS